MILFETVHADALDAHFYLHHDTGSLKSYQHSRGGGGRKLQRGVLEGDEKELKRYCVDKDLDNAMNYEAENSCFTIPSMSSSFAGADSILSSLSPTFTIFIAAM